MVILLGLFPPPFFFSFSPSWGGLQDYNSFKVTLKCLEIGFFCLLNIFLTYACRSWGIPVQFTFTAIAQTSALWKWCIKSPLFHSKFSGFLGHHRLCSLFPHQVSGVAYLLVADCAVEVGTGCLSAASSNGHGPCSAGDACGTRWEQFQWRGIELGWSKPCL